MLRSLPRVGCAFLAGSAVTIWTWAKPPSVRLTSIAASETGIRLEWTSSNAELEYTVEHRDGLKAGSWTSLPNVPWPVRTNRIDVPVSGVAEGYYRVRFDPVPGQRGRLVASTLVSTLNRGLIQVVFQQGGYPITAESDVQFYKLTYETIDPHGLPIVASGALALPAGATEPLPLVSYQHGTIVVREDVPSRLNLEGVISVAFATTGYAAVSPDYLGLGDSPGLHPFHHARSEARSVIDLLRAARAFIATQGLTLTNQLFLSGYSQGGHATLAALREIEAAHADEFSVTACAAGAGAYDLSGTTFDRVLSGSAVPNPYYYPYLLAAYVDVYDFAGSLADLLRAPWNATIPPLFDGLTESSAINAALPAAPLEIIRPELAAEIIANENHPLRVALRDNDVIGWAPRAPLRLYHCSGDQDVAPQNSTAAMDSFRSQGAAQVELRDPSPGANHGDCAVPTLLDVKAWFDSLR